MFTALRRPTVMPLVLFGALLAGCQPKYAADDSTVSAEGVVQQVEGTWTATVEKHPEEDNLRNLHGPLAFSVGPLTGKTASLRGLATRVRLTGTVETLYGDEAKAAGKDLDAMSAGTAPPDEFDGRLLAGKPVHARLQFETGDFEVPTSTGMRTVKGPLKWTGVLRGGQMFGEVSDAAGRKTRWYATKNDSPGAPLVR